MRCWLLVLCVLPGFEAAAAAQSARPRADQPTPRFDIEGEFRLRAETRAGAGVNPLREDGFTASRLRLDLTFRPSRSVAVFVQPQDSRVMGLASGRNPGSMRDRLDLRQAYIAVGRQDGPSTLYAGRRELDFLDARLLGRRNWNNVSPTWDGAMLSLRRGANHAHFLAFSQVDVRDGFNVPSGTRFVYGVVASVANWAEGHSLEPFLLATRRPVVLSSNLGGALYTAGARSSGQFGRGWDYQVMVARQGGGRTHSAQRAWAGTWGVGKTAIDIPARPRLGVEWSHASGDSDPLDERTGTFDTLFPSPHRIFGEQDLVGFRNVKILKAGMELAPREGLRVSLYFLDLRLASHHDGIYQTNARRRIGPPPGGATHGSIGSELDLVVRYEPVPTVEFRFGVSRFMAGPVVRLYQAGGESQTFFYSALTLRL